tara:strand:- start:2469 stop:3230 length:762 start_codon:yes stop_codon:yes gene_type:complete
MDIKERILLALGLEKSEEEITLAFQAKGEDGTIFVSTAEELEKGVDISVLTEDGTTIPLPKGTYKTADGVSFRVEEEGIVSEVMQSETEEKDTEEDEKKEMNEETELKKKEDDEDEAEDMKKEDEDEKKMRKRKKDNYMEEMPDWYKKTYEEMKDKIDNLMDAIADLKSKTGDDKEKDVKMSEENTEEKVELSSEEVIANLKKENEKLKTELSETPADSPININKFSSEKPTLSRKDYNKLSSRDKFLHDLRK